MRLKKKDVVFVSLLVALAAFPAPTSAGMAGFETQSVTTALDLEVKSKGKHPAEFVIEAVVPEPLGGQQLTPYFVYGNRYSSRNTQKSNKGSVSLLVERYRDGVFLDAVEGSGPVRNNTFMFREAPAGLQPGDRLVVTYRFPPDEFPRLRRGDRLTAGPVFENSRSVPSGNSHVANAVPQSNLVFVNNPITVRLHGLCNGEDEVIAVWVRFFRRNAAGQRVWMTTDRPQLHPNWTPLFGVGACFAEGQNSGTLLAKSDKAGMSTGMQVVFSKQNDLGVVYKRFNFEGEQYTVCHSGGSGC